MKHPSKVLLPLIFTISACGELERMGLDKEQKEYRKYHLNSELRMIQNCQRLNTRYTPQNNRTMDTHENVKYGDPYFYVNFYGSSNHSRCHVNIGSRNPQYQFTKTQNDGYEEYFCDYLGVGVRRC
tara:strand:+ start:112 stop:489 length:378 start_codon:yes stop_codon:yes gene_type:complete